MAKRLTDTEKWKDNWYVGLDNDSKIIWQWLIDNCDHAGIIKRGVAVLNMMCRTNISEDELFGQFNSRIQLHGDYYFIPKFLRFQYSVGLNSDKPVIKSVRKRLNELNLQTVVNSLYGNEFLMISESLSNHSLMIKDKDKDKDKNKDKVKDSKDVICKFERIWKEYPRPIGKKVALRHFVASVKTDQDLIDINKALNNYKNSEEFKKGMIQYGSTWFNNWRDWIDIKEVNKVEASW